MGSIPNGAGTVVSWLCIFSSTTGEVIPAAERFSLFSIRTNFTFALRKGLRTEYVMHFPTVAHRNVLKVANHDYCYTDCYDLQSSKSLNTPDFESRRRCFQCLHYRPSNSRLTLGGGKKPLCIIIIIITLFGVCD